MPIVDQITDEEIQHDINRKPAKVTMLSSGKIDKHEYMNILQVKKYYRQIKVHLYKNLNFLFYFKKSF